jgi:hypothetical protein
MKEVEIPEPLKMKMELLQIHLFNTNIIKLITLIF